MTDLPETLPEAPGVDWSDAHFGRYKMRRLVGTGGMGIVVAAHDPELDREVAIKLVGDEAARPIKEAQAMAKLSHPNVVQVYEVIRLGARTAIVMELVEGDELGAWQKGKPWRAIVEAYAQACRGLSAAHRANIVHRDFKPANALVDRDGVVRVTDFGLAHPSADAPLDSAGTPAYMAPEQHTKSVIDARTDQWSVACSLYEALYGYRPFEATDSTEVVLKVLRGELRDEPADSKVPRRVRLAIRRALSVAPADRFASIAEFAAAITKRPRYLPYVAAGAVVAVLALGFALANRSEAAVCQDLDAPINAVWSPQARGELRARMLAKDVGLPEVTVERALAGLDAYARNWAAVRTTACTETQTGARSTETLDTRMRCLDHGLAALSGLLEGLAIGDRTTLHAANDAVTRLDPPAACAEAKDAARPIDPAVRAELDAGDDLLARASAAQSLSQYERVVTLADRAIAGGERAKSSSLIARALVMRGRSEDALGHYPEAFATFQRAAKLGAQMRDPELVAEALVWSFEVEGSRLGRRANALQARPYVELAIESAGQPPAVRAAWLHSLGKLLYKDPTQLEAAAAFMREALEIRQRTLPAGHDFITDTVESLGYIEAGRKNFDEAVHLQKQVLEARIASRGPTDPTVSNVYNGLAAIEILRNQLLAALAYLEPAVASSYAAGKPNQHAVYNLGITQLELGRWAAAADTFGNALAIARQTGAESTLVAENLSFQGVCLLLAGDAKRAGPLIVEGAEMARRERSEALTTTLSHAVLLALHDGDKARARALVDEAMATTASNIPMRSLALALVVHAERGCATSRAMLKKVFDDAVESGDRSVQTLTTATLAECELAAGDTTTARTRLEAEIAWQRKMGSDVVARTPLERLLR